MNDAADELRRALEISPHHGVALMNLGRVLAETREPGRFDEAEALARRAVELMPGLPYAMSNLGHVLRLGGRTRRRRPATSGRMPPRAARRPPAGLRHRPRSGEARMRSGVSRPRTAIRPNPGPSSTAAEARHVEGLVSMKDGRLDEAEACFREALRVDPTLAASWLRLARIQEERGDFELSCQSARSALAVAPKLAEAYGTLAVILKGRLPDAEFRAMQALLVDRGLHRRPRLLQLRTGGGPGRTRALRRGRSAARNRQRPAVRREGQARPGVRSRQGVPVHREDHRDVHARLPRPGARLGRPRPAAGLRRRFAAIRDHADEQILASHPKSTGRASCTRS